MGNVVNINEHGYTHTKQELLDSLKLVLIASLITSSVNKERYQGNMLEESALKLLGITAKHTFPNISPESLEYALEAINEVFIFEKVEWVTDAYDFLVNQINESFTRKGLHEGRIFGE